MRNRLFVASVLSVLLASQSSAADTWPIPRRDAQRTAASLGSLFPKQGKPAWRAFMGGRPSDSSVLLRTGEPRLLTFTGGRVASKHIKTHATTWLSDLIGNGAIVAVADLDGDGKQEVVARTVEAAWVLDLQNGHTLWRSPPVLFQFIAAVRVVDLDGDKLPEVYIDECSACAKPGTMTAGAFTFKSGAKNGVALWTRAPTALPEARHNGSDSIIDLEGDGQPEIALGAQDRTLLVSGKTGAPIAEITNAAWPKMFTNTGALAIELDGLPGKEVVYYCTTMCSPPGLAAYRVSPTTGQWSELWTQSTGASDAEVTDVADVVFDANADGRAELALTFRANAAATTWATRIIDGATGAILATFDGRFEGAADLDGAPGDEVLIATPSGLVAHGWASGVLVPKSDTLPGVRALTVGDPELLSRGPLAKRLAVLKRPGQPTELLVGAPATGTQFGLLATASSFSNAKAVRLQGSSWATSASYTPSSGVITAAFRADYTTRPYPQVAFGKSIGTVDVLDAALQPTNGAVLVGGQPIGTLVGGNTGPMLGDNLIVGDEGGPFVVLPDGPRGLVAADARFASWITPPLPRWEAPNLTAVSFQDLGPLGKAVVGIDGTHVTARRSTDGASLGALDLGPGTPHGAPLPLRNGTGAPLVGIDWRISGAQIAQQAVSFTTGSKLWSAAPLPILGFFGSSAGDVDGDGVDEWYSMVGALYRRDITTGSASAFSVSSGYSLPMIASFSSSTAQVLLQAGGYGPKLVGGGMTMVWEGPAPEALHTMAGTRVACAGQSRFLTPAVNSPFIRAYSGATGGLVQERVLAGGSVFTSLGAAAASGKSVGMLSNISSIAHAGAGGPAVVAGSSDGHLYVLDACSLDLLWAENLGAPVGEPSIGDYDADGFDEIVAATSAGYVYGLDHPPLEHPTDVSLNGQSGPIALSAGQKLSVTWESVAGATSYQVALVSPDEQALWAPAYQTVSGTSVTLPLSEALPGRPYRVAVRAMNALGSSIDTLSAPLTLADDQPPVVSVQAEPLGPGELRLHLQASDDIELDYFVASWKAPTEAGVLADATLAAKAASPIFEVRLPETAWGQTVQLGVDVFDAA